MPFALNRMPIDRKCISLLLDALRWRIFAFWEEPSVRSLTSQFVIWKRFSGSTDSRFANTTWWLLPTTQVSLIIVDYVNFLQPQVPVSMRVGSLAPRACHVVLLPPWFECAFVPIVFATYINRMERFTYVARLARLWTNLWISDLSDLNVLPCFILKHGK